MIEAAKSDPAPTSAPLQVSAFVPREPNGVGRYDHCSPKWKSSAIINDTKSYVRGVTMLEPRTEYGGKRFVVSLAGPFQMTGPDGSSLRGLRQQTRTLIALLATSRNMQRSRDWLKLMLWPDSDEQAASANLRQAVHKARKCFGSHADVIGADRTHVWLAGTDLDLTPTSSANLTFFEDATQRGEPFEDWLRQERSTFEAACERVTDIAPTAVVSALTTVPAIFVSQHLPKRIDGRAAVVADLIGNSLLASLTFRETMQVHDLRQSCEIHPTDGTSVVVHSSRLDQELVASILARDVSNDTLVWTGSVTIGGGKASSSATELLTDFVVGAADALEQAVYRRPAPAPTLFTAVKDLFSLSRKSVEEATLQLHKMVDTEPAAGLLGWQGFGAMLLSGERLVRDRESRLEEADELIARALEADPSHPLALAVAGHYQAFVRRDFGYSAELLERSLQRAPHSAFVWDARAMHAFYSDNPAEGTRAAEIACRLGRSSPFAFYYDATMVISKYLAREYLEAIRIGERILAQRPHFLPVMRHLAACYAELGDEQRAFEMIERTRAIDPSFATEEMMDPAYPLPSRQGKQRIKNSISKIRNTAT